MSLGGSSVAVVQLPGGQFQVQGVIQSAQSSVIQSPQAQSATVSTAAFLGTLVFHSHCSNLDKKIIAIYCKYISYILND